MAGKKLKSNRQRWRTCFINKESRWRQTLSDVIQAVRLGHAIEPKRDKILTTASELIDFPSSLGKMLLLLRTFWRCRIYYHPQWAQER